MGRLTKGSKRIRIQDYMKKMRDTFRAALKDDDLQTSFDELRARSSFLSCTQTNVIEINLLPNKK